MIISNYHFSYIENQSEILYEVYKSTISGDIVLSYQYIRLVIRTLMADIIRIYIPKPVSKSSYSKSESFFVVHISLKVQYTSIKKLYKTDNVTRHWDIKHMKPLT